ncbi:MAG: hypothetical protein WAZ14_02885 [Patescibacteria group bacterium]
MTKIELLSVGLVIGVVGLVSSLAIGSARQHTRDVTRLAHVRELQIGLELFFNDHAAYPVVAEATPLGRTTTACLSGDGFGAPCAVSDTQTAYVEFVPAPPTKGLKGKSSCGGVKDAYCYSSDAENFAVQFELEAGNSLLKLQKGENCVTEAGLKAGACPLLTPVATEE